MFVTRVIFHCKMAASIESTISAESIQVLFKSLNLLIAPPTSKATLSDDTSQELLDSVLESNLAAFHQLLITSRNLQNELGSYSVLLLQDVRKSFLDATIVPVRQKFTEICICLLHQISCNFTKVINEAIKNTPMDSSARSENSNKISQDVPKLAPDALSIQQEKTLSAALQFVVVLGICPYLVPGVGIPVSQRLGPGQIFLATVHDYGTQLNDLNRIQYLIPTVKLFYSMLEVPSFKDIILNNYLCDLLAALLQVRHCASTIMHRTKSHKQNITATSLDSTTGFYDAEPSERKCNQEINILQPNETNNQTAVADVSYQSEISECSNTNVYLSCELPEMYLDTFRQPWTIQSVIIFCNVEIDRIIRSSAVPHVLTQLMLLSGGTKTSSGTRSMIPLWFKKTVAGILRDVIMVPPGVQHLLTLFLGDHSATNASAQDWQKCQAVAQIIARCPVNPNNIKQFYASVSRQLIELLQTCETKVSPLVIRAVGGAIQELTSQHPDIMQDVCLSHLFYPLLKLSYDTADSMSLKDGQILVPEETLTQCIICLHRLFVIGQGPQAAFLSKLQPVIKILFSVYALTRNAVSLLKSHSFDLIKVYLSHCDKGEAVQCLMSFASDSKDDSLECPSINSNVVLESGPDGGLQAVFVKEKQLDFDTWTQPVEAVVNILSSLKSDPITAQLFLCLLQKLTDVVTSEFSNMEILLPTIALPASQQADKLAALKEKISLVSLLASLGEKFGEQVMQSGHHVLVFVKATLERCVKICQFSHDETTLSFEWETATMAMGLLTAILSGALKLSDSDKKILDEILPLLSTISECDVADPAVKEMAEDLKVAVATRGLVWAEISKIRSKRMEQATKPETRRPEHVQQAKPLIQVLSETSIGENHVEASVTDENLGTDSKGKSETDGVGKFEQALQDLCDPLLPVKGHGLINLARMVEDRDPAVKDKQEILLKIFLENLTHTDSYIYLAAVNGLSALSDLCPDQVIHCLTSEFRSHCAKSHSSKSGEVVLKVGESVVKATKRLGELAPKYRDCLLPVILCGCRHEDALVRASSLSGLAEVCKLLRFSVGPILHELVTCCRDVMKSDPDPEPRKAAVLTLTFLLRGLGKDMLMTLSDALSDIYRILKHSLNFDPDEKVKFCVNLALGELRDIMTEILFTKPELKKTITILGLQ